MRIYDEFKSMFITICFLSYVFLISGLIVNFLQLCSCVIWPFSKELYRKINSYLALGIWCRKYYNFYRIEIIIFKKIRWLRIIISCLKSILSKVHKNFYLYKSNDYF